MAHTPDPLDHVLDNKSWVFFESLFGEPVEWTFRKFTILGHEVQITKFMFLELIAAVLVMAVFIPIGRMVRGSQLPKGPFWNFFEAILLYIRNEIAKPQLQEDTDLYMPFLWTLFFFILFCNLLGLVPTLGSPTASISMTAGLAVFSLTLFHAGSIAKNGVWKYLKSMWMPIEIVPFPLRRPGSGHGHGHDDHGHGHGHDDHHAQAADATPPPTGLKLVLALLLWFPSWIFSLLISAMVFAIEFAGTFIKSGVLALRLFVNMFAGHIMLASILLMIVAVGNAEQALTPTFGVATFLSVLFVTALSLLELFVAFIQAYVFTLLTALFLGMMLHPSH
jgi:F-type H+-transporting ATPase subunit a